MSKASIVDEYLNRSVHDGSVCCSFIIRKSRLAPIKTLTMLKFELNVAVIGVKLFNLMIHEIHFPIEKVKFWSESMLSLQSLRGKQSISDT